MRHDSHYVDELSAAVRTIGRKIAVDSIEPNPEQPRVEIGDLAELSASIKEKGVLEPLLVKKDESGRKWMIIAGERRWRASRLAGLSEVPCIEMDLDEKGVAEIALIENLQRKDLTVWEEADGLKALADKFGYKHDEIAQKISKSRSTVTEFMTIAGLPGNIRQRCKESNISSKSTLLEIARQFDEAAMVEFLDNVHNGKKPKREAKAATGLDQGSAEQNGGVVTSASQRTFRYRPPGSSFTVEVKFDDPDDTDKIRVLQALKKVFEEVKDGKTGLK
jgi:ParB family chromosome partitioning protein